MDPRKAHAEGLKRQGNEAFHRSDLETAIRLFSQAIQHDPMEPSLFTNRANCHLRLHRLSLAKDDAAKAIELNANWMKGHYYFGKVLFLEMDYRKAARSLNRAVEIMKADRAGAEGPASALASSQKKKIAASADVGEIYKLLYMARKRIYEEETDRQQLQQAAAVSFLRDILQRVRTAVSPEERAQSIVHLDDIERSIFSPASLPKGEIPEHFCCPISFDIMWDPVITPSGITYDRNCILTHLRRPSDAVFGSSNNGSDSKFDPISRQPLSESDLVPNLALRNSLHSFLESHPDLCPEYSLG